MTAPVFLVDRERLAHDRVLLDGPEGRHAATVRRIGAGERVDLVDGAGLLAECVVASAGPDTLSLDVVRRVLLPAPIPRLVVVQALPKGDRGELAVELMTEVGVDVVVPWAAARCVTQWRGDRGVKALTRWRSTAREAAKQARRSWLPEVAEPASTREVAELLRGASFGGVLHESAGVPLASSTLPLVGDVVLVVGPEGGVTDEELAAFSAAGSTAYRLGPTVLRTSTAGAAALSVVASRTARWA